MKNNTSHYYLTHSFLIVFILFMSGCMQNKSLDVQVFETSESGNKLTEIKEFPAGESPVEITINPEETYQKITGIGGSFTEATAYLLNQLSSENRDEVIEAYFGDSGARYSLTRTHMNSSDFSLGNYSYAKVEGDTELEHFTVEEDMEDLIPMIKDAMAVSEDGFKIIASPWTAPPWMKDNNAWKGGKLLPKYYDTWALFFKKYIEAYKQQGIDIWGFTVENEPLGNDSNWDSMHYTPEEMNTFVKNHLGPLLDNSKHDVKILGFDQNRDEQLKIWADAMYDDKEAAQYFDGIAVHWYASTYDYFPEALQYAHNKAPDKHLIQSEATVDAQVPVWQDDDWYWAKEATDWGYDWAPEDQKYLHPKYVPVYRYARDIIGTLNNHVDGWIDWNMVLNRQGGPNWAKNWCVAPVIVDEENDEVYYTPLYYTMAQFSRFIRPGSTRIGFNNPDDNLMVTAAKNPNGTIAVVVFNPTDAKKDFNVTMKGASQTIRINENAIQTLVISNI